MGDKNLIKYAMKGILYLVNSQETVLKVNYYSYYITKSTWVLLKQAQAVYFKGISNLRGWVKSALGLIINYAMPGPCYSYKIL